MAMQQAPLHQFNPFEIWSSAISTAIEATHAATTSWLPPMQSISDIALSDVSQSAVSNRTPPLALVRSEDNTPSMPSIFSFFSAIPSPFEIQPSPRSEAALRPVTSTKSWYRAPYKSPFDPMFWLSPGHPADHVPEWMVLTGIAAMMPGTTSAAATGWPMPKLPLWPVNSWNADIWAANPWGDNPWASNPLAAVQRAAPSPAANPWSVNPWTAWLDASSAGWLSLSEPTLAPSNVVDFSEAYSAYRTAGGHASAQLARASDRAASPRCDTQSKTPASVIPDVWTSLLWPWLPKN